MHRTATNASVRVNWFPDIDNDPSLSLQFVDPTPTGVTYRFDAIGDDFAVQFGTKEGIEGPALPPLLTLELQLLEATQTSLVLRITVNKPATVRYTLGDPDGNTIFPSPFPSVELTFQKLSVDIEIPDLLPGATYEAFGAADAPFQDDNVVVQGLFGSTLPALISTPRALPQLTVVQGTPTFVLPGEPGNIADEGGGKGEPGKKYTVSFRGDGAETGTVVMSGETYRLPEKTDMVVILEATPGIVDAEVTTRSSEPCTLAWSNSDGQTGTVALPTPNDLERFTLTGLDAGIQYTITGVFTPTDTENVNALTETDTYQTFQKIQLQAALDVQAGKNDALVKTTASHACTAFYLNKLSSDPAPTDEQVREGNQIEITVPDVEIQFSISALTGDTDYSLYVVYDPANSDEISGTSDSASYSTSNATAPVVLEWKAMNITTPGGGEVDNLFSNIEIILNEAGDATVIDTDNTQEYIVSCEQEVGEGRFRGLLIESFFQESVRTYKLDSVRDREDDPNVRIIGETKSVDLGLRVLKQLAGEVLYPNSGLNALGDGTIENGSYEVKLSVSSTRNGEATLMILPQTLPPSSLPGVLGVPFNVPTRRQVSTTSFPTRYKNGSWVPFGGNSGDRPEIMLKEDIRYRLVCTELRSGDFVGRDDVAFDEIFFSSTNRIQVTVEGTAENPEVPLNRVRLTSNLLNSSGGRGEPPAEAFRTMIGIDGSDANEPDVLTGDSGIKKGTAYSLVWEFDVQYGIEYTYEADAWYNGNQTELTPSLSSIGTFTLLRPVDVEQGTEILTFRPTYEDPRLPTAFGASVLISPVNIGTFSLEPQITFATNEPFLSAFNGVYVLADGKYSKGSELIELRQDGWNADVAGPRWALVKQSGVMAIILDAPTSSLPYGNYQTILGDQSESEELSISMPSHPQFSGDYTRTGTKYTTEDGSTCLQLDGDGVWSFAKIFDSQGISEPQHEYKFEFWSNALTTPGKPEFLGYPGLTTSATFTVPHKAGDTCDLFLGFMFNVQIVKNIYQVVVFASEEHVLGDTWTHFDPPADMTHLIVEMKDNALTLRADTDSEPFEIVTFTSLLDDGFERIRLRTNTHLEPGAPRAIFECVYQSGDSVVGALKQVNNSWVKDTLTGTIVDADKTSVIPIYTNIALNWDFMGVPETLTTNYLKTDMQGGLFGGGLQGAYRVTEYDGPGFGETKQLDLTFEGLTLSSTFNGTYTRLNGLPESYVLKSTEDQGDDALVLKVRDSDSRFPEVPQGPRWSLGNENEIFVLDLPASDSFPTSVPFKVHGVSVRNEPPVDGNVSNIVPVKGDPGTLGFAYDEDDTMSIKLHPALENVITGGISIAPNDLWTLDESETKWVSDDGQWHMGFLEASADKAERWAVLPIAVPLHHDSLVGESTKVTWGGDFLLGQHAAQETAPTRDAADIQVLIVAQSTAPQYDLRFTRDGQELIKTVNGLDEMAYLAVWALPAVVAYRTDTVNGAGNLSIALQNASTNQLSGLAVISPNGNADPLGAWWATLQQLLDTNAVPTPNLFQFSVPLDPISNLEVNAPAFTDESLTLFNQTGAVTYSHLNKPIPAEADVAVLDNAAIAQQMTRDLGSEFVSAPLLCNGCRFEAASTTYNIRFSKGEFYTPLEFAQEFDGDVFDANGDKIDVEFKVAKVDPLHVLVKTQNLFVPFRFVLTQDDVVVSPMSTETLVSSYPDEVQLGERSADFRPLGNLELQKGGKLDVDFQFTREPPLGSGFLQPFNVSNVPQVVDGFSIAIVDRDEKRLLIGTNAVGQAIEFSQVLNKNCHLELTFTPNNNDLEITAEVTANGVSVASLALTTPVQNSTSKVAYRQNPILSGTTFSNLVVSTVDVAISDLFKSFNRDGPTDGCNGYQPPDVFPPLPPPYESFYNGFAGTLPFQRSPVSSSVSWTGSAYQWNSTNQRTLDLVRDPVIPPTGLSRRSGTQQVITDSVLPFNERIQEMGSQYPVVVQVDEQDYRDHDARQLVLFVQSVALDEASLVGEELYLTVGGLPMHNRQRLVPDDAAQLADTNIVCRVPATGVYEDQGAQDYRVLIDTSFIGQLSFRLQTRTGADLSTLVATPSFILEFHLDARVFEG